MKASPMQASWRSMASVLLGCIVLTLVILVCVQLHTRLAIVALLCLLIIVIISLQGRFFVALLCSVLATLGPDYFFMQPVFSLAVTRPENIAALFTFLTIALVVSAVGSKLRKSYCELAQENAERKRAEEQQRYHTQLLKTVTDNASSMLFIVDVGGVGTFVNPAFERITGYRTEEVIGQVVHDKIHHTKPDGTHCAATGSGPVTLEDILTLSALPTLHGDPFDRLGLWQDRLKAPLRDLTRLAAVRRTLSDCYAPSLELNSIQTAPLLT